MQNSQITITFQDLNLGLNSLITKEPEQYSHYEKFEDVLGEHNLQVARYFESEIQIDEDNAIIVLPRGIIDLDGMKKAEELGNAEGSDLLEEITQEEFIDSDFIDDYCLTIGHIANCILETIKIKLNNV